MEGGRSVTIFSLAHCWWRRGGLYVCFSYNGNWVYFSLDDFNSLKFKGDHVVYFLPGLICKEDVIVFSDLVVLLMSFFPNGSVWGSPNGGEGYNMQWEY